MERKMDRGRGRYLFYSLALLLLVLIGCAPAVTTRNIENNLSTPSVKSLISDMEKDTEARKEMWYWLNIGRLYQCVGEYEKSISAYNNAESILTEYENRAIVSVRNVTSSAGSLLFSKGIQRYYGKGYERTLLHTMNGLNYVMLGKFEDAHVEMRKMEKRQELWLKESEEKIKEAAEAKKKDNNSKEVNTQSMPDGYSMRSLLDDPEVAAMVNNYQDAFSYSVSAIVSNMAKDPEYAAISQERATLLNRKAGNLFAIKEQTEVKDIVKNAPKDSVKGTAGNKKVKKAKGTGTAEAAEKNKPKDKPKDPPKDKPAGNITVTVVVFTGEAPSMSVEKIRLPVPNIGYTSVDLPAYSRPKNDAGRVSIVYNGQEVDVYKLLSADRMAYKTLKDEFPTEFAAAMVRAVGKGVIAYGAEKAAGPVGGFLASLASDAASSHLDLKYRNWEMLPNSAYLARFVASRNGKIMVNIDSFSESLQVSDKAGEGEFVLVSFLSPANVGVDHVNY